MTDLHLHHETFGDPSDPTLVLVNGLGSQCTNYHEDWCAKFVAQGFHVVRFDNRDVGLSTKFEGVDYTLRDMADDVIRVVDAVEVERAHVMGLSMGGMIVQRVAIHHPDRLLSMTSVMSSTGEPGYGASTPEAVVEFQKPPATSRQEYIDLELEALAVYGSAPELRDDDFIREIYGRAYDRCFDRAGRDRQLKAVAADRGRAEALRDVRVPTLVIHGSRDGLITPSGGQRTAELIPGARYVEIEGMGHDYPPAVWDRWVSIWVDFVRSIRA